MAIKNNTRIAAFLQLIYIASLIFNIYPSAASLCLSAFDIPDSGVKDGNFLSLQLMLWFIFSFFTVLLCSKVFASSKHRYFSLGQFWLVFFVANVGYFAGWFQMIWI